MKGKMCHEGRCAHEGEDVAVKIWLFAELNLSFEKAFRMHFER